MLKAPKWFTEVIAPFAGLFTKPTWEVAQAQERPTFSNALAEVRKACWLIPLFDDSTAEHDWLKIPRHLFQRMSDTLCYAT